MAQKNETPALIGATLAVAALLGGLWWIFKKSDFSIGNSKPETPAVQASAPISAPIATTPVENSSAPSQPGMRLRMPGATGGGTASGGSFMGMKGVPSGQFNYGGSTSWAPTRSSLDMSIQSALPQFQLRYVSPNKGVASTSSGVKMLLDRQLDFAQTSRPLTAQEKQQAQQAGITLQEIPVAMDGVAVAVNPSLNIPGLTLAQLQEIYTGKATNWQQVGGPNLPIVPISRPVGTGGTVDLFIDSVLSGQSFSSNVQFSQTTTQALQKLGSEPGGVYFASAPEVVPQCTVKPLAIGQTAGQFVPPYQEPVVPKDQCPARRTQLNAQTLRNGSYPLTRNLYVVVRQDASSKAGEAYANLLLSSSGQEMLEKAGFMKIR